MIPNVKSIFTFTCENIANSNTGIFWFQIFRRSFAKFTHNCEHCVEYMTHRQTAGGWHWLETLAEKSRRRVSYSCTLAPFPLIELCIFRELHFTFRWHFSSFFHMGLVSDVHRWNVRLGVAADVVEVCTTDPKAVLHLWGETVRIHPGRSCGKSFVSYGFHIHCSLHCFSVSTRLLNGYTHVR